MKSGLIISLVLTVTVNLISEIFAKNNKNNKLKKRSVLYAFNADLGVIKILNKNWGVYECQKAFSKFLEYGSLVIFFLKTFLFNRYSSQKLKSKILEILGAANLL